jgi:4-hydroxybenzoate polyprenyltransferase
MKQFIHITKGERMFTWFNVGLVVTLAALVLQQTNGLLLFGIVSMLVPAAVMFYQYLTSDESGV